MVGPILGGRRTPYITILRYDYHSVQGRDFARGP